MSLQSTSLYIQAAPLPATFKGSTNDFFAEMIKRMKIVSPAGTNFIFTGDTEPASNVGPWLRGGTQWWVWDQTTKAYVPQDLSASQTLPFFIGLSTPPSTTPPVWLRTTKDATDIAPTDFGEPVGWFLFDGTTWRPVLFPIGASTPTLTDPPIWLKTTKDWDSTTMSYGTVLGWFFFDSATATWVPIGGILSGTTAGRPAAPTPYQQYYDTDILCLIWFERGAWRTVSGVKGDVKAVVTLTLADALLQNPGWTLLSDPTAATNWFGRAIVPACANSDGSGALTPDLNIAAFNAGFAFPVGHGTPFNSGATSPAIAQVALWHLYKL